MNRQKSQEMLKHNIKTLAFASFARQKKAAGRQMEIEFPEEGKQINVHELVRRVLQKAREDYFEYIEKYPDSIQAMYHREGRGYYKNREKWIPGKHYTT